MRHRGIVVLVVCAAALAVLLVSPAGRAVSDELSRVVVTNWPETQNVHGAVEIDKPVRILPTAAAAHTDVLVSPVRPTDTLHLIAGRSLDTAGFKHVTLSLTGQVNGSSVRPGQVGAILLPDEAPIIRAFEEKGVLQFPIQVSASGVTSAAPYFASDQPTQTIAFEKYRVLFYNTCERSVTVSLFAYLTN